MKETIITNIVTGIISDLQTTGHQTTITINHVYHETERPLTTTLRFTFSPEKLDASVGDRVSVLFDLVRVGTLFALKPRQLVRVSEGVAPSAYHRIVGPVIDVSNGTLHYQPFTRIRMRSKDLRISFHFLSGDACPYEQDQLVSIPCILVDWGKGYNLRRVG